VEQYLPFQLAITMGFMLVYLLGIFAEWRILAIIGKPF